MRHHEDDDRLWEELAHKLIRVIELIIARLESESATTLHLTIKGTEMANYPLNAGDTVVVTLTDTDNVTGAVVVPDAGSVTVVLSSSTDTITANADGTYTITAGTSTGSGNTVTANGTVGGVASAAGVGTYDVVPAVVSSDATTIAVTFGTESGPTATTTPLSAAQLAALSAASVPFTAYPLTAAQVAALAAAGVPASPVPGFPAAPAANVGVGAGQINPVTGLVNP
jgi:hypothetical protein